MRAVIASHFLDINIPIGVAEIHAAHGPYVNASLISQSILRNTLKHMRGTAVVSETTAVRLQDLQNGRN